jgi:hypothetical protein
MAILVTPNLGKPTHDIKLSKGGTEIGLILCDQNGNHITRANREPYPNTAIKMYQGDAKHSDREPPFMDLIQQDWSLGRAQEVFEDDKARYQDGWVVDTTRQGKVILGPQPTFSTGVRDWGGYMPGKLSWQGLYGTQRYLERGWTIPAGGGFTGRQCEVLLRKKGSPNSGITIQLRDTTLTTTHQTVVIADSQITTDLLSVWVEGAWGSAILNSGIEYRLVVFATSGSDDVNNCWEIGCEPYEGTTLNSSKSSDGSAWTDTSSVYGIYFRVTDLDDDFTAHFVEYRDQLYFATAPDSGAAAKLYMNGARGVADDNTGDLDQLQDSAGGAGWGTLPGDVAMMITGNSHMKERIKWRNIVGGGVGYVTVEPSWNTIHNDTYDEYVVLGSDNWTERSQSALTLPCSDIEVANEIMYIAQGGVYHEEMQMHREKNYAGAFEYVDGARTYWKSAECYVDYIESVNDYISGPVLWMATNGYITGDVFINRDIAPQNWSEQPVGWVQIVDPGDVFNEQAIGNVTVGSEGTVSWIDVAEPFTTGIIASLDIPSRDIRYASYLVLKIKSSIDLSAGVLEIVFDDAANCSSPNYALPLPYLKAGYWVEPLRIPMDAGQIAGTDSIISVGWRLTQDVEAVKIEINYGVKYDTLGSSEAIRIPDTRVTGLERYGEPESCWVMCEGEIGEIRNNYYQPVPLRELEAVSSPENGKAHLVHDVYLYFSLKDGIEKYYRQHLDDMGPNRDLGFPTDRQGFISDMVGYPGRIYAAVDAGENGYSSVVCWNKGGWHEVYRSRFAGRRIRKLYIQSIPGVTHSRLWISEGSDILWIPVAINPLRDDDYRYTQEGAMITSRIHGGLQDVAKFFKSVKLATREMGTYTEIVVDYRTDEDTAWTRIANEFDTAPYQEEDLASTQDVTGRWIELRIVLRTFDNRFTPELLAWVIKAIEREEGKYANTYTFRVKDWDRDLQGDPQDYDVDTFMTDLESMVNDPVPMYVNSISDLDDSQYVVSQPTSLRRIRVIPEEDGRELHICQITLLEI